MIHGYRVENIVAVPIYSYNAELAYLRLLLPLKSEHAKMSTQVAIGSGKVVQIKQILQPCTGAKAMHPLSEGQRSAGTRKIGI